MVFVEPSDEILVHSSLGKVDVSKEELLAAYLQAIHKSQLWDAAEDPTEAMMEK